MMATDISHTCRQSNKLYNADVIWAHPFSFHLNNSSTDLKHQFVQNNEIIVTPNPFKEQLKIQSKEELFLSIFDIQGHCIYNNIHIEAGTQDFTEPLSPQLYFFYFKSPSHIVVKKILKE
jgi:hypothetical protein